MKQIFFYGLSIMLSWTAIGVLFSTYNDSQNHFSIAKQRYQKAVVAAQALSKNYAADTADMADKLEEDAAAEDEEESDVIPVTIMLIPSPAPMAKPPTSGKDAAPPPMEI